MAKPEKDPQAAAAFPVHMPFAESPWLEAEIERRAELSEDERRLLRDYARDGLAVLPGVAPDELIEGIRREVSGLFNPGVEEGPASYYRRQDAWETSSAVRDLALSPRVLAALELLYGRRAFPFQTLNFLFGSQQENHSDAILFNSLPPRFMCGVWVALEDVTEDNGPLFYYPGSHRLPQLYPEDFALGGQTPDEFFNTRYGSYLSELMRARGLERQVFLPKRGDALIWASNIVHGGTPRRDPERTRWSQVTHYFF
ncbi:MAG TPA: phytanoyl-CoA dioxygenase family protein, partial [Thermoanaerobaculia bacterium]|nr:phytanoyl-CoA dioxygenase family protein [Thermoanaerobaculia bacterium]